MNIKAKIVAAAAIVGVFAMAAAAQMPSWCPAWRTNTAPAGSPVHTHGQLRVEGNRIVDRNGNPVQLRGPSLYWSINSNGWNFYTADVVRDLRQNWNATVVRAAMGVERDFSTGDQGGFIRMPTENRNRVLNVIQGAITQGIYVIVDWHTYVGEATTPDAVTFFREMATCFNGVPNIIYEIYNEPNGRSTNAMSTPANIPTNRGPFSNGCPWTGVTQGMPGNRSVRDHMVAVTQAIRAIDQTTIILIGTPNYCQDPDIATAPGNAIPGINLAYTIHYYAGENASEHREGLRNKAMVALNRGYALFASEFGITDASGNANSNTQEADIWFDFLNDHYIGWAMWYLGTGGQESAMLNGNNINTNLTAAGTYVRGKLQSTPVRPSGRFRYVNVTVVCEGGATGEFCGEVIPINARTPAFITETGGRVSFIADTAAGWSFSHWSGDVTGIGLAQNNITLNNNINVTANFRKSGAAPWDDRWCLPETPPTSGTDNVCVAANAINYKPETCSFTTQPTCNQELWLKYFCPSSGCSRLASQWILTVPNNCFASYELCADECNRLGPPPAEPEPGVSYCTLNPSSVRPGLTQRNRATWSHTVSGNRFTLSGPSAARVNLYDIRGRLVRSYSYDGMGQLSISAANAGVGRGNYIVAVRDLSSGREVYRARVSFVR